MSSKLKKEKKKEKEKAKYFLPGQKMHFEEYQIPPHSQDHLKALLLEYIAFDQFEFPIHHLDIMTKIKQYYTKSSQGNDIYMKDLDLPAVIK